MAMINKPLVWLHGEIKTPPFSKQARLEVGLLLRRLQQGDIIGLPHSRPMPSIGLHCHELRIKDKEKNWRIIYRIDEDAIILVEVFHKSTRTPPDLVIKNCKRRLNDYDTHSYG